MVPVGQTDQATQEIKVLAVRTTLPDQMMDNHPRRPLVIIDSVKTNASTYSSPPATGEAGDGEGNEPKKSGEANVAYFNLSLISNLKERRKSIWSLAIFLNTFV